MQINPTQFLGLISFGLAALLNFTAWRWATLPRRLWGALGVTYTLMVVELWASSRFQWSFYLLKLLPPLMRYEDRRGPQTAAVYGVFAVALLGAVGVAVAVRYLSYTKVMSLAAVLCAIILFVLEAISLHAMDQVLYRQVGTVLLIGWLWAICGFIGAFAAAMALRR
jgi:hypothetical protein